MTSFDTIGTIALFNDKISKKQAQEILKKHNNIKTVAYKSDIHKGRYRLKKVKVVAGIKTKETTHKENKRLIKLDIEKCYFSSRLSEERKRISSLVKKPENVLVMFGGVGVYALVIGNKAKKITSIEINPTAHKYAKENVKLNKLSNLKHISDSANTLYI